MFLLLKCITIDLGKINYNLSHSNSESKKYLVFKFRNCVGKFQIEAGHHRKIEREGAVCINNID
jgi:hypothetical protein